MVYSVVLFIVCETLSLLACVFYVVASSEPSGLLIFPSSFLSQSGQERSNREMAGTAAVVKISAMHPDIEQDCVDCASHALHVLKLDEQKAVAQWIKREMDQKYGFVWHVIVGRQFGSFVAHDDKSFIYFFLGDVGFLMWRTQSTQSKTVSY